MATLINFNSSNKLLLTKSSDLFFDVAVKDWIATANKAIRDHDGFYVALSGGSTPLEIFRRIVARQDTIIDAKKIFLFWGDERSVPVTSTDSNYGLAMAILKDLQIPEENIFRMKTEIPFGATDYQDTIKNVVPDASFDMIMLGVGEDGHTLSLFPNTPALKEEISWVVMNPVLQLGVERMTLTLPIVARSKHRVVYLKGENKREIVKALFLALDKTRELYPIELLGTQASPLFWILAPDTYNSEDFDKIPSIHKLDVI
ncbi:6-phosphogluconolactonase [Chlamydia ibidis]|uniref:6-phosphogluconolactonase n=2 Tax=Chlamydia ibidis TaxID=1405396 RepID=S7KLJ9_9CHLA|nr:6-phosphogluconolactonase [Chlamydia ibidis]EPP35295.1 6-phosphogluconolactonase [Chlamydia ibidis]EQM62535.1 6-phosphogluconolactonase [Chlamydia ibidis 10-1398/6]